MTLCQSGGTHCVNHSLEAWLKALRPLLTAERDPKTVRASAHLAGMSISTFKERCRSVGVTAKTAIDHARVLRACILAARNDHAAADLLDVADPRTRRQLLERIGVGAGLDVPLSVDLLRKGRSRLPAALFEALVDEAHGHRGA